jgi:hypothetical protein
MFIRDSQDHFRFNHSLNVTTPLKEFVYIAFFPKPVPSLSGPASWLCPNPIDLNVRQKTKDRPAKNAIQPLIEKPGKNLYLAPPQTLKRNYLHKTLKRSFLYNLICENNPKSCHPLNNCYLLSANAAN